MPRRLVPSSLGAAVLVGVLVLFVSPASAEILTLTVRSPDGATQKLQMDVPPGTPLEQIAVPGLPGAVVVEVSGASVEVAPQAAPPPAPAPAVATQRTQPATEGKPARRSYAKQRRSRKAAAERRGRRRPGPARPPQRPSRPKPPVTAQAPSTPAPAAPDPLAGSGSVTGVPNPVIERFKVPIFLLPIYQAAGIEYGVRWEVLAAINEVETNYGRNLNVSSAGALGWMQFMPQSWETFGVDGNKDGVKDPYNPVDAIFAAANYLDRAGAQEDLRKAIFAYNHADWYVDMVLVRARMIAGIPQDLVGSLTGLTEGRFPVAAHARYRGDITKREARRRFGRGRNAARVIEGDERRQEIEIYARRGAPVVAVNDGVVKRIGHSRELGRYLVLQDVYGNRFTYAGLGQVARLHPAPRSAHRRAPAAARAIPARSRVRAASLRTRAPRARVNVKRRLFAHPQRTRPHAVTPRRDAAAYTTFRDRFARPLALDERDFDLRRLRRGSRVIGGTVLGRVGRPRPDRSPHLRMEIRPAGRGAPRVDPKPILDGWRLLESTAVYRASGRSSLRPGDEQDSFSIGQVLLLPKPLLERRVLSDKRIELYGCGRRDVQSGQVDRRVLATLAYLAEARLHPTVSSLKCGHSYYTRSGNVSHHSSGSAVDIAALNGVPIIGHQDSGGITDRAVRRLMQLQGTLAPDQIISLLDLGGRTFAMGDHHDHIHVGFKPLYGPNGALGRQALAVLRPRQWHRLVNRLGQIENPRVPRRPSRYAVPARRGGSGD